MKTVILIITLLAIANTASALTFADFVDTACKELKSLLDVVLDLVQCAVSILNAVVLQLVKLVRDLLVLDLAGIIDEIFKLVPNIINAIKHQCTPIVEDVLKVLKEIFHLVIQLLVEEGTLLAQFLACLIEILMGVTSDSAVSLVTNAVAQNSGVLNSGMNATYTVISGKF